MVEERIVETRTPAWQLPAIIITALLAIGGLAFAYNSSTKLDTTQQYVATQLKNEQAAVQQDVSSLKDRLAQDEKANTDLQGDLKVVTDKLKITQSQLKKARVEATQLNTTTAETKAQLATLDTSVHTELATKATADEVKNVDTRVTQVNSDLNKT